MKVDSGAGKSHPAVVFAAGFIYQNALGSLHNQLSDQHGA